MFFTVQSSVCREDQKQNDKYSNGGGSVSFPYASRTSPHAPKYKVNGKIRAREVRVLDADNQQIGIRSLSDALRMAQNLGVDLVEIAAEANPPVCRLINFGKFRYEESKREKKAQDGQRNQLKEIQLRPGIDVHDFDTKLNHAREFLESGLQVKISLRFRGRELRHPEIGQQVMERFVKELMPYGRTDSPPKRVDRSIHTMLRPVARKQQPQPQPQRTKGDLPKGKDTPTAVTTPETKAPPQAEPFNSVDLPDITPASKQDSV